MQKISSIAIVGAGQMGSGIAQVSAQIGLDVYVVDSSPGVKELAGGAMLKSLGKLAEKKVIAETPAVVFKRIQFLDSVEGLKSVGPEIVVEAITENFAAKAKLFAGLDAMLPPSAILASNTSSIGITELGAVTKRADRVIGMHFMNPVPLMKLVEIIKGLATSEETYSTVKTLAERLGKTTVVSADMPGFIVNRILMPMINEAVFALSENLATAVDIDTAMKLGTNQPMGPLQLADFIGLDTCLYIMNVLHEGLGDDKYRPAPLLKRYVQAGWLGKKSKKGFYGYET